MMLIMNTDDTSCVGNPNELKGTPFGYQNLEKRRCYDQR